MITPIVNSHIHTPYSFSSFDSIEHAVELAKKERVAALGISDFNTVEGFDQFAVTCESQGIFALYGIEFIAFSSQDKSQGLRWNDPKNPGVIYFCGKALNYPTTFPSDTRNMLASLWKGTQDHMHRVIERLNDRAAAQDLELRFSYADIRSRYAENTVRERHLAKAVFDAVNEKWTEPSARRDAYRRLLGDSEVAVNLDDSVGMQNVIRSRLFKVGMPAYVEERIEAFLGIPDIMSIVLSGGGIPCYPVLADDSAGLNERESDVAQLAATLRNMNIHAVEFIPQRNSLEHLRTYVRHFHSEGFCVLFGTEHNTPGMISMVPSARGNTPLDEELLEIGYRGACILAAHQNSRARSQPGFVDTKGNRILGQSDLESFIRTGDRLISDRNGIQKD